MAASDTRPDLVLTNATVITMSRRLTTADTVAIQAGRILWVGKRSDANLPDAGSTKVIDCKGRTLLPGFIDAHCHILAYAARLLSVDCGPDAVDSIEAIKVAVRDRAVQTLRGHWVRATGYDESALSERRHPTRHDLDEAAPDHPVRLDHRSSHATVLNSAALVLAGISTNTPEPPGSVIDRDPTTGEPTGLLLEMGAHLSTWLPPLEQQELRRGVALVDRKLLSYGITSVQDATPHSPQRWRTLRSLKEAGVLRPAVTAMLGAQHLEAFQKRRVRFGSVTEGLDAGPVKIMLTATSGVLHPPPAELDETIRRSHQAGFPVALHAVEAETVEAAANALLRTGPSAGAAARDPRDRIEHCSECPPHVLDTLRRLMPVVVTQPGFLYHSGRRYLDEVPEDMRPWLYRMRSWLDAGLVVAASSDAPIIDPNPIVGIYAAATRRARTGERVGEDEAITPLEALHMYTLGGACAASQEAERGVIEAGKLADLVLLDRNPLDSEPAALLDTTAHMTIIAGRVTWER